MAYIDIHTHKDYLVSDIITVRNIYPGESFASFQGKNYYSVGLHPWHIKSAQENDILLESVKKYTRFKHVLFIGECGLDKNCNTDFEEQKRVFCKQAEIAGKFNLPVIIHCVKAYNEVLETRKKINPGHPWILHSFTGSPEMATQFMENGFLFSFGNILFKENTKALKTFKNLPLEYIFLETDESAGSVKEIYNKAAELKRMDVQLLCKAVETNFQKLSDINGLA